jgi:hypothetical protein
VAGHHGGDAGRELVEVEIGDVVEHVEQVLADIDQGGGVQRDGPGPGVDIAAAIALSPSITSGTPTSPAWMMASQPMGVRDDAEAESGLAHGPDSLANWG